MSATCSSGTTRRIRLPRARHRRALLSLGGRAVGPHQRLRRLRRRLSHAPDRRDPVRPSRRSPGAQAGAPALDGRHGDSDGADGGSPDACRGRGPGPDPAGRAPPRPGALRRGRVRGLHVLSRRGRATRTPSPVRQPQHSRDCRRARARRGHRHADRQPPVRRGDVCLGMAAALPRRARDRRRGLVDAARARRDPRVPEGRRRGPDSSRADRRRPARALATRVRYRRHGHPRRRRLLRDLRLDADLPEADRAAAGRPRRAHQHGVDRRADPGDPGVGVGRGSRGVSPRPARGEPRICRRRSALPPDRFGRGSSP